MIAIYSKTFDERSAGIIHRLLEILAQTGTDVLIHQPLYDFLASLSRTVSGVTRTFHGYDDLPASTRFLVSVGGDGTFLNSINIIRDSGIPVVGINTGRLGFLAHITDSDLQESVEKLLADELPVEERTLMHATINAQAADSFPYALNDMVIQKNTAGLITVHTWSNDEFLNSYWADGLIVSTPTGSSAYSLSVGGPIVAPESQNFIISPIAAHNLNVRPLVIPDNVVLRLKAECRDKNRRFTLSLDSRSIECVSGTEIELKRAGFKVKIVKSASFYTTLRNKLMWGVDKRN
ncbi:MAG: NAD kinase [Bacteroidales bacterium]|jgi:NAD+ kinase|nr:NAD kinase [Bacteroidales bacterium]